ncbi:MAG: hypothetical protein IJ733_07475 [Lachnospiraceae bacterium]|nr:hypothetical protein [Lachnospiraceae bacterium]
MKRLISLLVALSLLLSSAFVWSDPAHAASTKTLKATVKVGALKKVSLKKYGIKSSDTYIGYAFDGDSMDNVGNCNINCVNNKLYLQGTASGELSYLLEFESGKKIKLRGKVTGKPSKHKNYNGIYANIKSFKGKKYSYTDIHLTPDYDARGNINELTVEIGKISNISKKSVKTDIKIAFYDKNKKKIETVQAGKQMENPQSDIEPGNEEYIYSGKLNLSVNQCKKVKYWRIIKM